ncbi:MAG: Rieske 2Fe-2S domain-containing protein [Pirellulales bacterium]|nr:Rieske 2Fe-2S domain-containing protein [Pirellulales bacterium]
MVSSDRTSAPRDARAGDEDRRSFFSTATAVIVGGIVSVFPFAAGLLVLFDPLRRQGSAGGFLRIASLDELPADGVPRSFPVITDRVDAWNKFVNEPVGMVFLRRTKEGVAQVEALNAVCPHAGCFVDFLSKESHFQCPCHDSSFEPNGTRIHPERCPSPRDLDALAVEIRMVEGREEVWVEFKNFRAGTPEKIADA